ncbi:family 16 glycosylhydrolase [Paenibacillus sp. IB182496]|uniref:Family 16 glycosylhydrolase n=1 Tax=Paenibacillus sabuli TaxID=2772509 RepID=A0A927GU13_9BACL|nr:family 16 glycosylhydrolase [Paenibacillus sabuli]MBD2847665.1 family 16 glycosylhydrolase [Paenibacillus sabuli]
MHQSKKWRILLLATVAVLVLLLQRHEAAAALPADEYVLVPEVSDEFDGSALDTGKWLYRKDTRFFGRNVPENVNVLIDPDEPATSALRLTFDQANQPNGGVPYTSGGVISKELLGYGYYEIRAKLWADGNGLHQSFWNMGLNYAADHANYLPFMNMINEIDMFEVDSDSPTELYATSHYHHVPYGRHVKPEGSESIVAIADPSAGYRVYGFEWLPDRVVWYVDGEVIKTYPYQGPHAMQNLWITALQLSHDALEVDNATLPGHMWVDYFRYYRKAQADLIQPPPRAILIDNADAAYAESGTWSGSDIPFGYEDRATRQSNDPGAEASWDVNVEAGEYEVFLWNPSYFDNTSAATAYTVSHSGRTASGILDQSAAGQNWVSLGIYAFAGESGEAVAIAKPDDDGRYIRADSVMLAPVAALAAHEQPGAYAELEGTWGTSTAVAGWDGGLSRYASGRASARLSPEVAAPGTYAVQVWLPVHANNSTSVTYSVYADGQSGERVVNAAQGSSRWLDLGTYTVQEGEVRVEIANALGYGVVRADAVKLIPSVPQDAVAPAQPQGLDAQASVDGTSGNYRIALDWADNTEDDLAGYIVEMNGYRIYQTLRHRSRATLERLLPDHTFAVAVRAVDYSGNVSAPAVLSVTSASDATPPAVPGGELTARPGASGTLLAELGTLGDYWRAANTEYDLQGYYYYVDGVRHNSTPVGRTYTVDGLTNGKRYAITVTAVDMEGNESAPTAAVNAAPIEQHIAAYATELSGYTRGGDWIKWWQRGEFGRVTVTQQYGPDAYFEWAPVTGVEAKTYEVWVWNARHMEGTTAARYTIANGTDTVEVMRSQFGKTPDSGWDYLGTFAFSGTEDDRIRVRKDPSDPDASTYLLANGVKLVPVAPITIDYGDSGYLEQGGWHASGLAGHDGDGSRYADPGSAGSASVRWTPTIAAARMYDVYLYKVTGPGSDPAAEVKVHYDGGESVHQLDHVSGDSEWVYLGRYPFRAGEEGYVESSLHTDWAVARADAVRFEPVERPIIVDNGDVGYSESGSWQSSGLTGYNGTGTRFSATSTVQQHSATWRPDFPGDGLYTVSIYQVVHATSDPNTLIEVVHSGGTDTHVLDYSAGSSGWVELGTYAFDEGEQGYVRLWHQTAWRNARADAVRWEPAAP